MTTPSRPDPNPRFDFVETPPAPSQVLPSPRRATAANHEDPGDAEDILLRGVAREADDPLSAKQKGGRASPPRGLVSSMWTLLWTLLVSLAIFGLLLGVFLDPIALLGLAVFLALMTVYAVGRKRLAERKREEAGENR
ncbi:MAG: hypothetical protein HY558_06920 [Euryarchaeota archaeon]|nr:hypothetical protein [Euryarchaeota archaeon]